MEATRYSLQITCVNVLGKHIIYAVILVESLPLDTLPPYFYYEHLLPWYQAMGLTNTIDEGCAGLR